jgi:hypothetical protein
MPASRRLAANSGLLVEFAHGNFIPAADKILMRAGAADGWDCR